MKNVGLLWVSRPTLNKFRETMDIFQAYTLKNKNGLTVTIGNIGAVVQSIKLPDVTELALGFENLADYQTKNTTYLGTVMGRISSRIS